jgi:hypothetical protein
VNKKEVKYKNSDSMTRCTTPFLGGFVIAILFSACDYCETKGTVTFDNTERLWCNCEVTWPNGDEYVIEAGESRTYEFQRGTYEFGAYCGNDAWDNTLCGLEEGAISRTFTIDCEEAYTMNLNF